MPPDCSTDPNILVSPLMPAAQRTCGTIDVPMLVAAPPRDPSFEANYGGTQPPLRLGLVVDCSASMAGRPSAEAMHSVRHIVSSLPPEDQVALVLFDEQVEITVPLQRDDKVEAVSAAFIGVECGCGTAPFDAWDAGARQLAQVTSAVNSSAVSLKLITAHGVVVEPLGATPYVEQEVWQLPGLVSGAVASALFTLHLGPDAALNRQLLKVKLLGDTLDLMTTVVQSWPLFLDNIDEDDMAVLPNEERVLAKLLEVRFDESAIEARAMIRNGKSLDALNVLGRMGEGVAGHLWLDSTLEHLKNLACRSAGMSTDVHLTRSQHPPISGNSKHHEESGISS